MSLPFTPEQFLDVFRKYNDDVWPMQFALIALGAVAAGLLFVRKPWSDLSIAGILAFLWGWMGVVYHLLFFAEINQLAVFFGIAFVAAAVAFAVASPRLHFEIGYDARSAVGAALLALGLLFYPLLSLPGYPDAPTFGLPCPTTLFTLGLLAFLRPPYSRGLFLAPILWSLVGGSAALFLGMAQDLILIAAAGAGVWLATRRDARQTDFRIEGRAS